MNAELKILASTHNFRLATREDYPGGYSIAFPHLILSRNYLFRYEAFFTEHFIRQVGEANLRYDYCKHDFAYYLTSVPDKYKNSSEQDLYQILSTELRHRRGQIEYFFNSLWFVKDNSVSINKITGFIKDKKGCFLTNTNARFCSTSAGGYNDDTTFTENEILSAWEIMKKMSSLATRKNTYDAEKIEINDEDKIGSRNGIEKSIPDDFHQNTLNSIERSLTFLNLARGSFYLPYKIAFYIPVLESLFSPDSNSSSDTICKRVANYLSADMNEEKSKIFQMVKICYKVRSKFFHGDDLPIGNEDLKLKSIEVDRIVRKVLTKVIMHDSDIFKTKTLLKKFVMTLD